MNDEQFACTELPGGLRVLSEHLPGVRSVSAGVWVRFGTVHESLSELGVSHLVEHMVFKGTGRRSARDIVREVERLGGSLDAYTATEHTGYSVQVLDEHLDSALDVLADLVLDPAFNPEDLERERRVVLEEISAVEDTPEDLVFELHADALWDGHPYGYPILGTRETVSRLSVADLRHAHGRGYHRSNLVVAAAGNVTHDAFVERVRELFERAPAGPTLPPVAEPRAVRARRVFVERATAQTHLVVGTSTFGHDDPRRYALALLTCAFGGGMSSRLFQRVREELGLAYSVYSFQSIYTRAGIAGVYVGTSHRTAGQAEEVLREEMARLAREGLDADELADSKGQVKGQLVLSLETTGARLQRLAGFALHEEPFLTLDEVMARVEAVTLDEVAEVAAEYFDPERQVVLRLGPEV